MVVYTLRMVGPLVPSPRKCSFGFTYFLIFRFFLYFCSCHSPSSLYLSIVVYSTTCASPFSSLFLSLFLYLAPPSVLFFHSHRHLFSLPTAPLPLSKFIHKTDKPCICLFLVPYFYSHFETVIFNHISLIQSLNDLYLGIPAVRV